jgi:hypothetical protein
LSASMRRRCRPFQSTQPCKADGSTEDCAWGRKPSRSNCYFLGWGMLPAGAFDITSVEKGCKRLVPSRKSAGTPAALVGKVLARLKIVGFLRRDPCRPRQLEERDPALVVDGSRNGEFHERENALERSVRINDGVIDQRKHQIDPARSNRVDPNEAARRSQKQPGQDLRDPQKDDNDAE